MKSCWVTPKRAWKYLLEKKGCHAYTQDQINQLIVDNALTMVMLFV
jgi:uroporphyrin-III C-methyltransferase